MAATAPSTLDVEQAIVDLLRDEEVGALATTSADGYPHCTTMHFAGDGLAVYFSSYTYTRKFEHVSANPRVSYSLAHVSPSGFDGRDDTRWLSVEGHATIVTKQSEINRAVEVSLEQFSWAREFGLYANYQRPGVSHRGVFIRVDPVKALWGDNRVRMQWEQLLTFTPDGKHVEAMAPYDNRRGEPVVVDSNA